MKDLNIRHETIKILEENTSSKISYISHNNIFANVSPRARENVNKWDYIKLEGFFTAKENINKTKRGPTV